MSRASVDTSAVADAVVSPAARSIESRFLRASGLVTIGHVTSRVVSLIIGIATARLLTDRGEEWEPAHGSSRRAPQSKLS